MALDPIYSPFASRVFKKLSWDSTNGKIPDWFLIGIEAAVSSGNTTFQEIEHLIKTNNVRELAMKFDFDMATNEEWSSK